MRPEAEEHSRLAVKMTDLERLLGPEGVVLLFSNRKSTEHVLGKIMCEFPMYKIEMLVLKAGEVEKSPNPAGSAPQPHSSFPMGNYQTLSCLGNCMS